MGIEINENVLLTIAGVIFVPIFVFLIKMIMEVANTKTRMDTFQQHVEDSKQALKKVADFEFDMKILKKCVADIDNDLKYLFSEHSDITQHGIDEKRRRWRRFGIKRGIDNSSSSSSHSGRGEEGEGEERGEEGENYDDEGKN